MFNYTADELKNFEKDVIEIFREGILPFAIHFSDGNEDQLIEIFREINDDDYVFSTHRSHYHYLLKGGRREDLIDKIKNCKSMYVFSDGLSLLRHPLWLERVALPRVSLLASSLMAVRIRYGALLETGRKMKAISMKR